MKLSKILTERIKSQIFEDHYNIEKGLMVTGKTQIDNNKIRDMLDETDYYAEWNARDGYWFFKESNDIDTLEYELTKEFNKRDINAIFELVEFKKKTKIKESKYNIPYKKYGKITINLIVRDNIILLQCIPDNNVLSNVHREELISEIFKKLNTNIFLKDTLTFKRIDDAAGIIYKIDQYKLLNKIIDSFT